MSRYSQKGRYHLKRWRYYERNFPNMQSEQEYLNALVFLTALKELSKTDIKLLAERYYNVEDYTTVEVKPVPFIAIARKRGGSYKQIQSELGGIEEKIGGVIDGLQPKLKVTIAKDRLAELELFTLSRLDADLEQQIMKDAFKAIRISRK